ncbi:aspartate/glutamate racemase family protein [Sorangium sp. So ce1182]|uniref:aspartate/glutamate racemase family protein n=1 Tax=Sorangium sp. So ce1182 TaxID=3133334 RepID=UPI003F5D8B81
MMKTLTFLHTSPVHIATFDRLLAEMAPTIPAKHAVDESLLRDARASGLTPDVARRIEQAILGAVAGGAAVVLCTCSTIGGCAERAGQAAGHPVLRVDRAMAERAVAAGGRIVVAATLASTIAPTRELVLEVAGRAGRAVSVVDALFEDAWAHFERGDQAGYLQAIAAALRGVAPSADAIVLAQASMADAVALCPDVPVPVFSSPRPGLEAAIRAYRSVVEPS